MFCQRFQMALLTLSDIKLFDERGHVNTSFVNSRNQRKEVLRLRTVKYKE